MSWIDIFLSDGDPHRIYGADAQKALSSMPKIRDLPLLWIQYSRAGLPFADRVAFLALDVVRSIAYRNGFRDGATFPWPEQDER